MQVFLRGPNSGDLSMFGFRWDFFSRRLLASPPFLPSIRLFLMVSVCVCVQVLSVWPGLQGLPTLLRLRPRCGHPV